MLNFPKHLTYSFTFKFDSMINSFLQVRKLRIGFSCSICTKLLLRFSDFNDFCLKHLSKFIIVLNQRDWNKSDYQSPNSNLPACFTVERNAMLIKNVFFFFRLIVVAEKNVVYNSFPIPLINRLEKHFLVMSTSMTVQESELSRKLDGWADSFATVSSERYEDGVIIF